MKLNVTPAEAAQIQREADACHGTPLGPGYNEYRFLEFMRDRFGVHPMAITAVGPGDTIQVVVRKDVGAIPCPGVPRLEEE